MTQEMLLSPGAVAEYMQISYAQARAAIAAAGLLDERGRPKQWFTGADCDGPLRSTLVATAAVQAPAPEPAAAPMEAMEEDELGEPETVSSEDLAQIERQLGRPVEHAARRRKR